MSRQLPDIEAPTAALPYCDDDDGVVETTDYQYPIRAPGDWVVSGVLGLSGCTRPAFDTLEEAESWALQRYGDRLKGRIKEAYEYGGRWAFLIKGVDDGKR